MSSAVAALAIRYSNMRDPTGMKPAPRGDSQSCRCSAAQDRNRQTLYHSLTERSAARKESLPLAAVIAALVAERGAGSARSIDGFPIDAVPAHLLQVEPRRMFTADLFGNPIYPAACDQPDADPGNGITYRQLALIVRAGEIPPLELLAACGLEPEPILARLKADGTLDDDLNPVEPIDCTCWTEETEQLEAALLAVFANR